MKRLTAVLLSFVMLVSITACGSGKEKETLHVFNWGEYIGSNVISDFEREFDVKVIYDVFESNESMYTKLQGGENFDILVPSDYMIERLIEEELLQPLDKGIVKNLSNLYDGVKNLPYDPDNTYSAPYFWGSVGLVYNTTKVDTSTIEKEGYNILKNSAYKDRIYVYNSERDSFMMALKALGYSMNTENEEEILAANDWLKEMFKTTNPIPVTDRVIDDMINGQKDIAVVYSGDAAYILSENEDMSYIMPEEGTNIWSDAMVIPANAKNPELANQFINFILSYEASYANSEEVGYASSNKQVIEDMTSEDGDYADNVAYLPRIGYEKDEVFKHNDVLKKRLSELWTKLKAGN